MSRTALVWGVFVLITSALSGCAVSVSDGTTTAPSQDEEVAESSTLDEPVPGPDDETTVEPGGYEAPGNPYSTATYDWEGTCHDKDLLVDQDGSVVSSWDSCGTVTVTASWARLDLMSVEKLVIEGNHVTVSAMGAGEVELHGSGNVLELVSIDGELINTGVNNKISY